MINLRLHFFLPGRGAARDAERGAGFRPGQRRPPPQSRNLEFASELLCCCFFFIFLLLVVCCLISRSLEGGLSMGDGGRVEGGVGGTFRCFGEARPQQWSGVSVPGALLRPGFGGCAAGDQVLPEGRGAESG